VEAVRVEADEAVARPEGERAIRILEGAAEGEAPCGEAVRLCVGPNGARSGVQAGKAALRPDPHPSPRVLGDALDVERRKSFRERVPDDGARPAVESVEAAVVGAYPEHVRIDA